MQDNILMDSVIGIYRSLDELPSDELRQLTVEFGETLCRYKSTFTILTAVALRHLQRLVSPRSYITSSGMSRPGHHISFKVSVLPYGHGKKTPKVGTSLPKVPRFWVSPYQKSSVLPVTCNSDFSKGLTIDLFTTRAKNSG